MAYQYANPYAGIPMAQAVQAWPYQAQMQQYQQPVNGLVKVSGIEGARAYQLPPNSVMPLFDADRDVVYRKVVDGNGMATVTAYSYSEIKNEPQGGSTPVVTREEFDELCARVAALTEAKG